MRERNENVYFKMISLLLVNIGMHIKVYCRFLVFLKQLKQRKVDTISKLGPSLDFVLDWMHVSP